MFIPYSTVLRCSVPYARIDFQVRDCTGSVCMDQESLTSSRNDRWIPGFLSTWEPRRIAQWPASEVELKLKVYYHLV